MVLSIQVITVIRVGAPTEEIINRVIDIILIPEQIGTRIQTTRILSNGVTDASTRKNEAVTIKVKQFSLMMNSLHAFFLLLFEKKRVSRALLDRLSVRSDEVLMLKLLSLKLFTVANLRYQLS